MSKLCLAAILCALVTTRPPAAQDDEIRLNADFAWGRQYRPGSSNPVVITIDNPGPEVSGTLQLRWSYHPTPIVASGAGLESLESGFGSIHEVAVVIPKQSRRRYFVSVECPDTGRAGLWAILTGVPRAPKLFGITATAIAPEERAVALIGTGDAPGFSRAGARILLARPEELPDRWHGYAPLDIALWMEGDASVVEPAQIEGIKRWVAFGGHLIVARSSAIGFSGTFLEELAGVRSKEIRPHGDWSPLGELADVEESPKGEAVILDVAPQEGEVLARAGDRPLVVRRRVGRGLVTFLAFDPSSDAFRDWAGNERFWGRLAGLPEVTANRSFRMDGRRARMLSSGSRSPGWQGERPLIGMGGLAHHMMSQPGVPVPPIGAGLLLLLVYAVLIGPVDYFVLRRLKRFERTWITFPAVAIAFALILVTVGFTLKRNAAMVRDVLVEDHMGGVDLVRGWSLTTVTLPDRDVIWARMRNRDGTLRAYDRQGSGAPGRVREGRLEDWEFAYGSVGLSVGEWCEPGARLRVERVSPDRIRVVNDTGAELRDAAFAANGRLWTIGGIAMGESHHDLAGGVAMEDYGGLAVGYAQSYYGHLRSEAQWGDTLRRILLQMSLAPGPESTREARGIEAALDLSPWLSKVGGVLLGWSEGDPVLELSRGAGRRPVYRLLRGFTRHD